MKRLAALAILFPVFISCSGAGVSGGGTGKKAVPDNIKPDSAKIAADALKNGPVSVKIDGRELSVYSTGPAEASARAVKEPPVPSGGRIASRIAGVDDVTFNIIAKMDITGIEKFYRKSFTDAGYSELSAVNANGLFHARFDGPDGAASIYAYPDGNETSIAVVISPAR